MLLGMCVTVCQLVHPDKQHACTVVVNINYRRAAVVHLLCICFSHRVSQRASCGWERRWALQSTARNADELFGASLLHPYACVHKREINIQINCFEYGFTFRGKRGRSTLGLG